MAPEVSVLPESPLEFRYGQAVDNPHDGLALFGPFDADTSHHPASISYGLIGTPTGVKEFNAFSEEFLWPIYPDADLSSRLWPMFPGFEAAFACKWPLKPTKCFEIDASAMEQDSLNLDPNKRAAAIVERYLAEISRINQRDERLDFVICVVPDIVHQRCRPLSRIPAALGPGKEYQPEPAASGSSGNGIYGIPSTRLSTNIQLISAARSRRDA